MSKFLLYEWQTVWTLIRRRRTRRLIWVYTVCSGMSVPILRVNTVLKVKTFWERSPAVISMFRLSTRRRHLKRIWAEPSEKGVLRTNQNAYPPSLITPFGVYQYNFQCQMILSADSEGPDQTARMRSHSRGLIWTFVVRACFKGTFSPDDTNFYFPWECGFDISFKVIKSQKRLIEYNDALCFRCKGKKYHSSSAIFV